jgi:hypothetical protein
MSMEYITEASFRRTCGLWELLFHPFTDRLAISLASRSESSSRKESI